MILSDMISGFVFKFSERYLPMKSIKKIRIEIKTDTCVRSREVSYKDLHEFT